jgi:two-component system cell cycle sensor histidine kinase PleC
MIERKNYEMEFRIIRPTGEARFIVLQGRCEMDAEGDVSALFGIMQDVTERNQYEEELREAKESAERAYSAKSQFLANMSHELRTPLNAIIGFSEMMQRQMLGPIGTEKYLDYIGGIRESGEHLLDMITDILDMSKIEAGKYTLDIEEFNLYKVIRLASHMIEGRALDAQVKIISDIPEKEDMIMAGDRRAIMQMILNILSNAVKFTKPNGEVRISCTLIDNMITMQFVDTGIGIPASKLRYVTKPFEQAANSFTRNHEGTGLGLAITKELAELHGGKLELKSTVGVGTTVTITVPIKK